MKKVFEFDDMADRCIAAGEAVMKGGSPDLQAAMRVLLAVLGREIAAGMNKTVPVQSSPIQIRRHLN